MRNRGTIGGSLANNDPAACYPAAVLGSGAVVVTNSRRIAADDFFQGMFTTALEPGEIITEVGLETPLLLLNDLPLDLVGQAIARTPVDDFLARYEASRS